MVEVRGRSRRQRSEQYFWGVDEEVDGRVWPVRLLVVRLG